MASMKADAKTIIREETRELDGAVYTYRLSSHESDMVACYGLTLYCIEIKMTDKDGRETRSEINDVFSESKLAFRFFTKLVSNLATPIDLPYIIEDEMR